MNMEFNQSIPHPWSLSRKEREEKAPRPPGYPGAAGSTRLEGLGRGRIFSFCQALLMMLLAGHLQPAYRCNKAAAQGSSFSPVSEASFRIASRSVRKRQERISGPPGATVTPAFRFAALNETDCAMSEISACSRRTTGTGVPRGANLPSIEDPVPARSLLPASVRRARHRFDDAR